MGTDDLPVVGGREGPQVSNKFKVLQAEDSGDEDEDGG